MAYPEDFSPQPIPQDVVNAEFLEMGKSTLSDISWMVDNSFKLAEMNSIPIQNSRIERVSFTPVGKFAKRVGQRAILLVHLKA